MARIENTVFISYRRTDVYTALAVYENLKNQGYDVFFDYRSISSGDFEQIITSNIRARAHFLLILTQTALDRCNEPGDWLRREIEIAIDEKRNIVPLLFKGFRFGNPSVSEKLTGKLKSLSHYNGLNVHEDYFDEAMHRLRTQYLNIPLNTVLHPVSTEVQKVVRDEQVAADKALEQIDDVKKLVGQGEDKLAQKKEQPKPVATQTVKSVSTVPWRPIAGFVGGLLLIAFLIWGGINLLRNQSLVNLELTATNTLPPVSTLPPTETSTLPTPTLGIGSTMISDKDGMNLLYIPAGEFTMGSDHDDSDEKPGHTVTLDAYWIDQTEVTNTMYAKCVNDGKCNLPRATISYTRDSYYGNSEFDNYPVIYVSWEDANAYCSWADRRLPTEAEWEKAARGESAFVYPWGNDFDGTNVNFCDKNCSYDGADKSSDDGFADTAPVGSYPNGASPYDALDMAGNVWEWVNDWYDVYPGGDPNASSDFGQKYRVQRGGTWFNDSGNVRAATRWASAPTFSENNVGFRCAASQAEQVGLTQLTQTSTDIPSPSQTTTYATPTPSIGATVTGKDGMTLLYVPAGEFTMGSNSGASDAQPVHKVQLNAFWIDQNEVTNAMYAKCVQAGPCSQPISTRSNTRENYYALVEFDNYPVIYVTWNMANTYCTWADRSLPTEAQWEKAARGDDARPYPWGIGEPNHNLANYDSDDTTEVGIFPNGVSPYGALDMGGNVWEWVADRYSEDYYRISPSTNPLGPNTGEPRVQRGGSWVGIHTYMRATQRNQGNPLGGINDVGFRCAMSATP